MLFTYLPLLNEGVASWKTDGGLEIGVGGVLFILPNAIGLHRRLLGLLCTNGSKSRVLFRLRVAQAIFSYSRSFSDTAPKYQLHRVDLPANMKIKN